MLGNAGVIRGETVSIAEKYIRLYRECLSEHAEPLVYLGDALWFDGRGDEAIELYKQAMSKKYGTGGVQRIQYYEEIPANRLMVLMDKKEEFEQALWYTRLALEHSPANQDAKNLRKEIIGILYNKECI